MKIFARDVLCCVSVALVSLLASGATVAAPSKETMERCAQYAERAVQQYNLMNNNPQCHVEPALRWQPNYDNHYNGCLVLPEFMANSEETIRVTHLKSCGAMTDAGTATSTSAKAEDASGAAKSSAATASASASASTGSTASATPSAAAGGAPPAAANCHPDTSAKAGAVIMKEKATAEHGGYSYALKGPVLTYIERDTKKRASYSIARPSYYINMMNCAHQQLGNYGFPWVWLSPDGKQARLYTLATDDTLTWFTISATGARELLSPP